MPADQEGPTARPHATAKHTPGPWEIRTDGNDQLNIYGECGAFWIALLPHQCIWSIEKQQKINAKLIAASPALADALEAFVAEPLTLLDFGRAVLNAKAALREAGRLP